MIHMTSVLIPFIIIWCCPLSRFEEKITEKGPQCLIGDKTHGDSGYILNMMLK